MSRTWREKARPIIAAVIARVGLDDRKALRKALVDAYPFGERKYWPYKAWCSEMRTQLNPKAPKRPDPNLPAPGPSLFPEGL